MKYEAMTVEQRAEHLLEKGVKARIAIDQENMQPAFIACVPDIGTLPCGFHETQKSAVAAGIAWLKKKLTN